MKKLIMFKSGLLALLFIPGISLTSFSQCSSLIIMTDVGVEDCILPVLEETQQILLPCITPDGFWTLDVGEYAYIDYEISGCASFCQLGLGVDITCFMRLTGLEDQLMDPVVKLYPTITESHVVIECKDLQQVKVFNMHGNQLFAKSGFISDRIDVSNLSSGIYYVSVMTSTAFHLKTFIKI